MDIKDLDSELPDCNNPEWLSAQLARLEHNLIGLIDYTSEPGYRLHSQCLAIVHNLRSYAGY